MRDAAWHNKTPLIPTAGQPTRETLLLEPLLTNLDSTTLPRPYVKLALETARPQDAPGALLRAHALAAQPPTGPLCEKLDGHDLVLVPGAPVFRYYHPYVPGQYLSDGTHLIQVTDDPAEAARPGRRQHPGRHARPSASASAAARCCRLSPISEAHPQRQESYCCGISCHINLRIHATIASATASGASGSSA